MYHLLWNPHWVIIGAVDLVYLAMVAGFRGESGPKENFFFGLNYRFLVL
jgi:hypothetical protein